MIMIIMIMYMMIVKNMITIDDKIKFCNIPRKNIRKYNFLGIVVKNDKDAIIVK